MADAHVKINDDGTLEPVSPDIRRQYDVWPKAQTYAQRRVERQKRDSADEAAQLERSPPAERQARRTSKRTNATPSTCYILFKLNNRV